MSRSRLDPNQIAQFIYDHANRAIKVSLENMESSVELSHTDGDSLYAIPKQLAGVAVNDAIIPCADYKRIAIYSVTPTALVLLGSADGTTFISIDNSNATYILKDIAATHIKLTFSAGTVKYVLQS